LTYIIKNKSNVKIQFTKSRRLIKSTNSKSLWPRKSNKIAEFAAKEMQKY